MHHYIYCIENLINGKVYVGKHSTENLNDGYMGSGKLLNLAIQKYGIEKFRKHVLSFFDSSEEAFDIERQLVNEEFVANENTYNLIVGGCGFDSARASIVGKLGALTNLNNPEFIARHVERCKQFMPEENKRRWKEGIFTNEHMIGHKYWLGKHHVETTKVKIGNASSRHQSGKGNSQYGLIWIFNTELKESKRVNKENLHKFLEEGWKKGRKIKWK